jgi:hypothetical protein
VVGEPIVWGVRGSEYGRGTRCVVGEPVVWGVRGPEYGRGTRRVVGEPIVWGLADRSTGGGPTVWWVNPSCGAAIGSAA